MVPTPVQKDRFYFNTLCSSYSLRDAPFVSAMTLKHLSSPDNMEEALKFIDDHGDGRAHVRVNDHHFVSVLDEIVQYFEGMRPVLNEIMETAAREVKEFLQSGHPDRKNVFIEFQSMLQMANKKHRSILADNRRIKKSELYASFETILKDDDLDIDDKLNRIISLHEESIITSKSHHLPTDD
jgi:hypothetical protein